MAVFVFEDQLPAGGMVSLIDQETNGVIEQIWKQNDFSGKLYQTAILYPQGDVHIRRIILVGLGKKEEFSADKMRNAGAKAGQTARSLKVKSLAVALEAGKLGLSWEVPRKQA